jgi:hypothetical protein
MTQTSTWAATLARIGEVGLNDQIIDPACVITVSDGAPLLTRDGTRIGEVIGASVIDGYLVVTGTLDPDRTIPNALPTFDGGPHDRRTFSPVDSDGPHCGTTTFHTLTVTAVRSGFEPAWSNPEIMFARDWCVQVLGPDDLIPMPDYATADRAATRFNRWWQDYRARRLNDDGVDLPETPAIVCPWPYDADDPNGHAEALAALSADDPDGWLSA